MITAGQFKTLFPRCGDAAAWAEAISRAWQRYGFDSVNAQAGFLAICANETGGFVNVTRENMGYTLPRAIEVFSKAKAHPDIAADRLAKGSMAFANWIYAGVIGNGDEASGDGWRFRGRGIPQLTGRANYKACGDALGIDLIANPDLLCNEPDVSAAAAAWFMAKYRPTILPALQRDGEQFFLAGAKLVGATTPEATLKRLDWRRKALAVLNAAPALAPGRTPPAPSPGAVASPATAGAAPPDQNPVKSTGGSWLEGIVALLRSIFVRKA